VVDFVSVTIQLILIANSADILVGLGCPPTTTVDIKKLAGLYGSRFFCFVTKHMCDEEIDTFQSQYQACGSIAW